MTKEEAIKFLEKLDYRSNKYGQLLFLEAENKDYIALQYQEAKITDHLLDRSDGQFSGGYCEEVYYSNIGNEYKIFDIDPNGNVIAFETRRKY